MMKAFHWELLIVFIWLVGSANGLHTIIGSESSILIQGYFIVVLTGDVGWIQVFFFMLFNGNQSSQSPQKRHSKNFLVSVCQPNNEEKKNDPVACQTT